MTIWVKGTSRRIASVAVMPSMSDMLMSIRMTSGLVSLAISMASSPERAAPTTAISDSNCSSLRMFSRVSAKSSTIHTRILLSVLSAIQVSEYRLHSHARHLLFRCGRGLDQWELNRSRFDAWLRAVWELQRHSNVEVLHQVLQRDAVGLVAHRGIIGTPQRQNQIQPCLERPIQRQGLLRRDNQGDQIRRQDGRWCDFPSGRLCAGRRLRRA